MGEGVDNQNFLLGFCNQKRTNGRSFFPRTPIPPHHVPYTTSYANLHLCLSKLFKYPYNFLHDI